MSVVGFDVGNLTCFVAVAKQGGIETVANEYSQRSTPSYVGFTDKVRLVGLDAKNIQLTGANFKNIVFNFKRLLGRKFSDPFVKEYCHNLPYKVVSVGENDEVGVRLKYKGTECTLTVTQIMAALLVKLKGIAETALRKQVVDCVVSIPSYYTDIERRAMLDACRIAELNCLRLMNDTTATALCYGFFRKELPEPTQAPRNVIFVDFGHSAMQVSAVAFNKGTIKVLAVTSDPFIGGNLIDKIMTNHIAEIFMEKYHIEPLSQVRPFLKLTSEVEKLKVLMSANKQKLPLAIECFMNDKDVNAEMSRAEMEEVCKQVFQRIRGKLEEILKIASLEKNDTHSIEIVGGSSRVALFKAIVQEVFGLEPSTTLNADESVARGCALQCAMLSSASQVQLKWAIHDACQYPITLGWKPLTEKDGSIEVFQFLHTYPATKMLTFYRKEAFDIEAQYSYPNNIPYHSPFIGSFTIHDVDVAADGGPSKIKVKLHLNKHGILNVSEAVCVEKMDEIDEEVEDSQVTNGKDAAKQEQDDGGSGAKEGVSPQDTTLNDMTTGAKESMDTNGSDPAADLEQPKEPSTANEQMPRRKTKVKNINLPVKHTVSSLSNDKVSELKNVELTFQAAVKEESEKAYAKNSLEEYVLELRRQLDEELAPFVKEADRDKLKSTLFAAENWLWDEGDDCERQVYVDKLGEMKKMGNPVITRKIEFETRPKVLDKLGAKLQSYSKVLDAYEQKSPDYEHIGPDDMKKVKKAVEEKSKWFNNACYKLSKVEKHQNPPILVADINEEFRSLDSTCGPIVNKPKPKVEAPPTESQTTTPDASKKSKATPDGANDSKAGLEDDQPKSPNANMAADSQMEVDANVNDVEAE